MDITITGYDGENVIAQIIQDLLTVNGLSVTRENKDPTGATMNIEQLDHQLANFRKNKTIFNIKVVRDEQSKYVTRHKRQSEKIDDITQRIDEIAFRLNIGMGENFIDPAPAPAPAPVPAPARIAQWGARVGSTLAAIRDVRAAYPTVYPAYAGGAGGGGGDVRLEIPAYDPPPPVADIPVVENAPAVVRNEQINLMIRDLEHYGVDATPADLYATDPH